MRDIRSFLFLIILGFGFVAPTPSVLAETLACGVGANNEAPDILQARLKICEEEIKHSQAQIDAKGREATSLQRDIAILDYRIQKAKTEIRARDINILNLQNDIKSKNNTITTLGEKIKRLHISLSELLRKTNENDAITVAEAMLSGATVSDMFADAGAFNSVHEKIQETADEVRSARAETEAAKKVVEARKQQEAEAKQVQELEKQRATLLEKEKNKTLLVTKGQEAQYKKILAEKQRVVNEIKNRMIKFTGGNELKFGEALALVRVSEAKIGVRAAFVLAILTQESGMNGVIGGNLGKCFYNTGWNNKAGTVMSESQKPSFLALMAKIGKDPDTTPVSCPIMRDGQYGGAMGPSQFMPTTWWDVNNETGVADRVAALTGNIPASPFNNLDAFTATAIYLNDGLQGCKAAYSTKYNQESCAAAKYYAGGKWKSYMKSYGASVASRAAAFQRDIDILDSQ